VLTFTDFLLLENCYLIRSFLRSFILRAHHRQYVVAVVFLVAVWFEKFFLTERDTVERVSTDRQTDRERKRKLSTLQRKSTEKVNRESQQRETHNSARHSRET
jgi:hypothetical protein